MKAALSLLGAEQLFTEKTCPKNVTQKFQYCRDVSGDDHLFPAGRQETAAGSRPTVCK